MIRYKYILLIVLVSAFSLSYAQKEVDYTLKGNTEYKRGNYIEAEKYYNKALEENTNYQTARYNLAAALYKQDKFYEASITYKDINIDDLEEKQKSNYYHNQANSQLQFARKSDTLSEEKAQEYFKESIENYKNSLRLAPDNDDTRYNMEYAKKFIKDDENDGDGQDNKQQQEQNQDKNEEQQDQQDQQQQQSKEDMQRALDRLKQEEQQARQQAKENEQDDEGEEAYGIGGGNDW